MTDEHKLQMIKSVCATYRAHRGDIGDLRGTIVANDQGMKYAEAAATGEVAIDVIEGILNYD
jgi:hypothetical protein